MKKLQIGSNKKTRFCQTGYALTEIDFIFVKLHSGELIMFSLLIQCKINIKLF